MNPKVSIITACKNADSTLEKCLQSVGNQEFQNFEHIVIDGGSTDDSIRILKEASREYQNLQWVSEPDSGIAEAMNKGIRMAVGDWILALHADDSFVDQHSLTHFSQVCQENASIYGFSLKKTFPQDPYFQIIRARPFSFRTRLKIPVPHQSVFIKRKLFDQIGHYDESFRITMDYDWLYRAYLMKIPMNVRTEVLTIMSGEGISSQTDRASIQRRFTEEKRVHLKNSGFLVRYLFYKPYWSFYFPYAVWKHSRPSQKS